MSDEDLDRDRVVVLRDGDGNTYLLPWPLVEAVKVPADQVAAVEDVLVDDVTGFSVEFFNGRMLTADDFRQEQGALPRAFDLDAHFDRIRSLTWDP